MSLLILGGFAFEASGPSAERIKRKTADRRPGVPRIRNSIAYQWMGPDESPVTVEGCIWPGNDHGTAGDIEALHAMVGPSTYPLMTGYGLFIGMVGIKSISDERIYPEEDGYPQKITFSLDLIVERDATSGAGGGAVDLLGAVIGQAAGAIRASLGSLPSLSAAIGQGLSAGGDQ